MFTRKPESKMSRRSLVRSSSVAAAAGIGAASLGRVASASSGAVQPRRFTASQEATPEAVNSAVEQLQPIIADVLDKTKVPGMAVAIVSGDDVIFSKGFGVRSVDSPDTVDDTTVFQLASVSKSLASTTIATLVTDGTVTWDSRIIDHYPDFQLTDPWIADKLTIRDCLSHRSGMFGTAGDDLEIMGYSRDEIIHRMRYLNITEIFRQTYSYSNMVLTLGGEAAAKAAGTTWEDLSQERLYGPLGMTSSSSRYDEFAKQANRAALHIKLDGKWTAALERHPDPQSPAGGVSSNAVDMAKWLRMLIGNGTFEGNEVISPEALYDSWTPAVVSGKSLAKRPAYYGCGWAIEYDQQGRFSVRHAGAFSVGARTVVRIVPNANLGVAVLANAFPTGAPEAVADSFFDLALNGQITFDWLGYWNGLFDQLASSFTQAAETYATPPANPEPGLDASAYAGTYANDYFGDLTVEATGDKLSFKVGPTGHFDLEHWTRDTFVFLDSPEFPGVKSTAIFEVDATGQPSRVTVNLYDNYGQGTFTRVPSS